MAVDVIVAEAAELLALHSANDYVSDVIRQTGDFFERDILDEIARRVKGGVLIDVGAHIGNHTVFMAEVIPHSAIHAFEPLPVSLGLLRRNTAQYPNVWVHPVALSDKDHVVRLMSDPGNLGHTVVEDDPYSRIYAWAFTLDSFEFDNVSLIKVDVEGWERHVLAGARQTIERSHPLVLIEDWPGEGYGDLLPGYRLAAEWAEKHQTYLYEWAP